MTTGIVVRTYICSYIILRSDLIVPIPVEDMPGQVVENAEDRIPSAAISTFQPAVAQLHGRDMYHWSPDACAHPVLVEE